MTKLHRPYSRIRNRPEMSVTEIIGLRSIPGLPWGAAKETAIHAVDAPETWQHLERDPAVEYLRRHHRGVWDGRAAMGTAVHAVMESWISGETVDLEQLVKTMATEDRQAKTWQGHEEWAVAMLTSYVEGLERFWTDHDISDPVSEECVRTPGDYVGQRDLVAMTSEGLGLFDIKTTSEQDAEKGIYHSDWAMQLAAYRYAKEIVHYDLDPKGKVIETGTEANYEVEFCGIIHLRGDSSYTLYRIDADLDALDAFWHLLQFGRWNKGVKDPVAVRPYQREEQP